MQIRLRTVNIEKVKRILRRYKEEDIKYNEPHFSIKLEREKIDKRRL